MAATGRTRPNSARPTRANRARPTTVRLLSSRALWRRTCGSRLQRPCVPVAFAMPVVDPKHQQAQAEWHGAVVEFGPNTGLVAAVGGDQSFVQDRQAANLGELLDRGVDGGHTIFLAAGFF